MMKDIFPFSQLGHALTHHYPIDLIHGFPSISLYLPLPSAPVSLLHPLALSLFSSIYLSLHLPIDPSMLTHNSYLPHRSLSFPSLNPLSSSLCPSTSSQFSAISSSLKILTLLMHYIHLHFECFFFYIILRLCHSMPVLLFFYLLHLL